MLPRVKELGFSIGAIILFFIECGFSRTIKNLPGNDTTETPESNTTLQANNTQKLTTDTTLDTFLRKPGKVATRALIVCICLTIYVVIYFGVRAIRIRRRKTRKYGVLANSDMELTPLDAEDEDDMTLFDRTRK